MLEPHYSSPVQGGLVGSGLLNVAQTALINANTNSHHHRDLNNDTAVDLSRKTFEGNTRRRSSSEVNFQDSDEDAPLDLKVRKGCTSLPGLQQRAKLLRIAELCANGPPTNLMPLPPTSRDNSQERDDSCQYCGTDKSGPDYEPSDHKEGVCNKGSIACTQCPKTFTLYSDYDVHKKSHQKLKQRQYPCQTCGKIFTSASNRNMHQRIHKGVRPFQCTPCGVFFRQKAHLQKHQKTQGHIQATEIFEKKKREGHVPEEMTHNEEDMRVQSEDTTSEKPIVDSTQSFTPPVIDTSTDDASPASSISPGGRTKSSPKRKQARPQYLHSRCKEEEEEEIDDDESSVQTSSEDKIRCFVDYNDITHGYECRQCAYSSHELSVLKEHVREEHLSLRDDLLICNQCQISFKKPFIFDIHNKKHKNSSQDFSCNHCSDVFKVASKLIKHMESIHSVCPYCGDKQDDTMTLLKHQEDCHSEQRRGFHSDLLRFTPLNQLSVKPQTQNTENRAAKMRKLDTLAEVIRQKQLQQQSSTLVTLALNGNDMKPSSPLSSPFPRRRKNDMSAVKALLGKNPEPLSPHSLLSKLPVFDPLKLNPVPDMICKSENNNILSSLKLPPSIRLPTQPPIAGLTSPSSPSAVNSSQHPKHHIHGELSVTIVPTSRNEVESDDGEETGLDLSVGKKKTSNSDENEVSTTAREEVMSRTSQADSPSIFPRMPELSGPHATSPFPPPSLGFPFPFPSLIPPVVPPGADPTLTEHLIKLSASLPHTSVSNPVLSAMLGHPPYQPPFPGMSPSLFSAGSSKDSKDAIIPRLPTKPSSSDTTKPFSCSFCQKEFSHLSSLEAHMEHQHSGESKYVCNTCGKNFSSKSNLTAHQKIHSGKRPFECAICHKCFRQKAHLQKHETTHSSATPYQCNMCDKAFGHPSNLNTHMATHSNIRPYHCGDCGKSYKDAESFKHHCLSHSGEHPYVCSVCWENFIDSEALKKHREVIHPNAASDQDLDSTGGDKEEEEEEIDDVEEVEGTSSMNQSEISSSLEKSKLESSDNNTTLTSAYSSFETCGEDENQNKKIVDSDKEEIDVDSTVDDLISEDDGRRKELTNIHSLFQSVQIEHVTKAVGKMSQPRFFHT